MVWQREAFPLTCVAHHYELATLLAAIVEGPKTGSHILLDIPKRLRGLFLSAHGKLEFIPGPMIDTEQISW
jgi:hypothetical protein